MTFTRRIEQSELGGCYEARNFAPSEQPRVNPEIVDEIVPIVAAGAMFSSVLLAKSAYVMAGLGPKYAVPASFGIGALAAVIAYGVFSRHRIFRKPGEKKAAFALLPVAAALASVFVLMLGLLALLGMVSSYGIDFLCIWAATSIVLMFLSLALLSLYRRLLIAEGRMAQRVAVYGSGDLAMRVIKALVEHEKNAVIVAMFDDASPGRGASTDQSGSDALFQKALKGEIDRVIVALPPNESDRMKTVIGSLEPVPIAVQVATDVPVLPYRAPNAPVLGSIVFLDIQRHPLGPRGIIFKTLMDYALGAVALVAVSPLLAIIAIAIKFDSRGPVFFVQPRGGYRHKVVNVYKFRTMRVMETGPEIVQASRNDPRVTRVGKWLRRTSLDELPQLINVLRGELSLVGPRPHALAHDEHYGAIIEQYANRHKIKPGITGLAQINGCRSETRDPEAMRRRVDYDLRYIDNWSPWLDLKILSRTVGVVLWDRHAY